MRINNIILPQTGTVFYQKLLFLHAINFGFENVTRN